ncbi:MAG: type IV pilus biogenesis/stability protein PilW [Candidatus Thiodiazotropha taylori]|uniref:Type IV pilus biogenesis/stability protein PilW n=1 Tax=Candidatus Thiodiazotropha taylori TaxID=2792791 RepID=A0A9E4T150_9GAMM|nr:type IV pilus biogenesis/stability protein PilW [Candidatus Thiodiazotropha taylori]MCG7954391.1 type IV pilus biogenesis/stability protein PilW [Candidatus Thiodiazotropha taylori]MCG7968529.1 type IV pilus biogenesis/stability protein PilW [Candidatus Thiodiazotropha taylori]MCG8043165.1 type IV pilus biogenesis/stability protein PilW [Candidatus Thiodiazotropha taylori]MCG8050349.1 type IV pilus biogenesis/stability protein PilW [Candidatus Thiodiazotropha taylori]
MNSISASRVIFTSLLVLLLSGCATQQKSVDTTGSLGREKRNSPAKIYVDMGIEYMRDGQSAVALKKLKKAIKVDDDYPQAHNVIAILYERLGNQELAGFHYEEAIKLDGQDPYIRNARGSFYCKQGRLEDAEFDFQRALSNPLYPTPWVALTNAGLCRERAGDQSKAENYYRRALTANPRYATALYQMAELSLEQQKDLSARAYLERYHGESRPSAASLLLGIKIEKRLKDLAKADEYRGKLFAEFPDAPEIQMLYQAEEVQ